MNECPNGTTLPTRLLLSTEFYSPYVSTGYKIESGSLYVYTEYYGSTLMSKSYITVPMTWLGSELQQQRQQASQSSDGKLNKCAEELKSIQEKLKTIEKSLRDVINPEGITDIQFKSACLGLINSIESKMYEIKNAADKNERGLPSLDPLYYQYQQILPDLKELYAYYKTQNLIEGTDFVTYEHTENGYKYRLTFVYDTTESFKITPVYLAEGASVTQQTGK